QWAPLQPRSLLQPGGLKTCAARLARGAPFFWWSGHGKGDRDRDRGWGRRRVPLFAGRDPAVAGCAVPDGYPRHSNRVPRLGGALALRTAAACPDDIAAAVSLHGGNLFTAGEDSPHRVLPDVRAQLYFGHADQDPSMPAEAIAGFEASLMDWGGAWRSEVYP